MIPVRNFEGGLVDAPELRFSPSGQPVCTFRIACSDSRKNDSGQWETTRSLYLPVTVWGKLAEHLANTLVKGSRVCVFGKLETRQWQAQDGSSRSRIELGSVDRVYGLLQPPAGQQQAVGQGWGGADDQPPF